MKIRHLEFSVVVVAHDHNPTILNPDFLERQEIVPAAWGWKVTGPPITTPPFARVSYDSKITVTIEANRLIVSDLSGKVGPGSSKVIPIAKGYVEVLPHVRYSAVGINFRSLAENDTPSSFLMERFLKPGSCGHSAARLQAVGIKLIWPLNPGRLTITLDVGAARETVAGGDKEIPGIVAHANFHRDCQGYPAAERVVSHLERVKRDWATYRKRLAELLGT